MVSRPDPYTTHNILTDPYTTHHILTDPYTTHHILTDPYTERLQPMLRGVVTRKVVVTR